jgi:hypothetical protein
LQRGPIVAVRGEQLIARGYSLAAHHQSFVQLFTVRAVIVRMTALGYLVSLGFAFAVGAGDVSELSITHLLSRDIRHEVDFMDQLFNSSEKRTARIILLLSHFHKESRAETALSRINQEHLAQMVGSTRSRVSHFKMKFKTRGFNNHANGLTGYSGLLSVVLHNSSPSQTLHVFGMPKSVVFRLLSECANLTRTMSCIEQTCEMPKGTKDMHPPASQKLVKGGRP